MERWAQRNQESVWYSNQEDNECLKFKSQEVWRKYWLGQEWGLDHQVKYQNWSKNKWTIQKWHGSNEDELGKAHKDSRATCWGNATTSK